MRDHLFISYSREDRDWLERFRRTLQPWLRSRQLKIWDDDLIEPGDDWRAEISKALASTRVAVLMVSAAFLDSGEAQREVDALRAEADTRDLPILWIAVAPSLYKETFLRSYEALNSPDKPLSRMPKREWQQELVNIAEKLGRVVPTFYVPLRRNRLFTGREDLLLRLHADFDTHRVQMLAAPGGYGKTQIALEYAYRFADRYRAVLWGRDLGEVARVLGADVQGQDAMRDAVRRWLNSRAGWLLVVDSIEFSSWADTILPDNHRGHVLVTARNRSLAHGARTIEVPAFTKSEARTFLQQRCELDDTDGIDEIVSRLEGVPISLEQAAAFIVEHNVSFRAYLEAHLASRENPSYSSNVHTNAVAPTLTASLAEIARTPQASDAVRLMALLGPAPIPVELLKDVVAKGPLAAASDVIAPLLRYSLATEQQGALSIHVTVQDAVSVQMTDDERQHWRERAVAAVSAVFPYVEFSTWPSCERLVPHGRACATYINDGIETLDAARLMNELGRYLADRGAYAEAEPMYRTALAINENLVGPEHRYTASVLNNLASLLRFTGRLDEAEPLYNRALTIREQVFGPRGLRVAQTLNNIGVLYRNRGRPDKALPLFERALEICKEQLTQEHWRVSQILNNLGALHRDERRWAMAEDLLTKALAIREKEVGPNHPRVAQSLHNLALLYLSQGDRSRAEALFDRALAIREREFGQENRFVADTLKPYATLLRDRANEYDRRVEAIYGAGSSQQSASV